MKPNLGSALLGLAVSLVAPLALKAGDTGPEFGFKLRALVSAPASDTGLANNTFSGSIGFGVGFGVQAGWQVGKGKVVGELGYSVQPGDEYLANTAGQPINGGGTINAGTSIESRKNKLEGMLLRVGYEGPWTESLNWRAGLQFGGNKFTHQVLGNVNGTGSDGAFSDSYHYVGSKSSMAPSPYVGGTWKFDESSALEFGVLLLQYSDLNYQHVANSSTNQFDTVPSRNRMEANLEVAYLFRF